MGIEFIKVSLVVLLTKYFYNEHINEDEICTAWEISEIGQCFLSENLKEMGFWEDMAVGQRIILK